MRRQFTTQRASAKAIDGTDRSLFLWLVASLFTGTVVSALIALWALAANVPTLG